MDVNKQISPSDNMFQGNLDHYFHVGESALECIYSAIASAGKNADEIKNILDFPSGYGRVLRFLKTAFQNASITACDLDTRAVDFCAATFNARPVYSSEDLKKINLGGTFDLIWVGSFFTHIDLLLWEKYINLFSSYLNPDGILIVTLHGSQVIQNIQNKTNTYGLSSETLEDLQTQYFHNAFGYVNYPNATNYGISVSSPSKAKEIFSNNPDLPILSYEEKGWDNHQDVICLQKKVDHYRHTRIHTPRNELIHGSEESRLKPSTPGVIFCLPEGLTLGGVTTWSVELSRGLSSKGIPTFLGIHPSRYNNPAVDFGISEYDHLIDCNQLRHPDDPKLKVEEYIPLYQKALPGVLIPNWSWGTYAMAALFASKQSESLRVIGMAHSDESGYYQWLVHYESIIHKFLVANKEILRKLSIFLPHRVNDIHIKPAPVKVPEKLDRAYSPPNQPLQLVYGGRLAQYQKRVFDLIDLAYALVDEGVNFKLRIIGGGADKEDFYKRVSKIPDNVKGCISLEESIPLSDLPDLFRSTDINIMVSEFEGVSNTMLMGMAEGCVPVMTEVSGTVEVITSGTEGYLVPVGDMKKMAQVIKHIDTNRDVLLELGKNSHKKVNENYSQSEYNAWFIDVINQVWREPARPWPPSSPVVPFLRIHQEFERLNSQNLNLLDQTSLGKKKILFLSHDPNWGGAPKVLYSLVKGLNRDEWTPIVALPDKGDLENEFVKINVKTYITPMQSITVDAKKYWQQYEIFSRNLKERTQKVAEIISQERIDIVVTNTVCIFEGALAAKLKNIPHIWYIHELTSKDDKLIPLFEFPMFYAAMDFLSTRLVVISKVVEEEITQYHYTDKVSVIYTGLEQVEHLDNKQKLTKVGILDDSMTVTFIGVISERKGVLTLVDTARLLVEKYPKIIFIIVGKQEGETYERLKVLITQSRLEDYFKFLGFRNDVPNIIARSDIVVIPSLIEPFSLVALEAMQLSKPVIATRSGGPEEIIVDGQSGILVPVNDPPAMAEAIDKLLSNPELMETIGRNGFKRFHELFLYDHYINQFDALLNTVISDHSKENQVNPNIIEDFMNLASVASQVKGEIAALDFNENPNKVVDDLLNYPKRRSVIIPPVSDDLRRPKISVCVPIYNGEQYLQACINSILSQSYSDFELILVDDCSTDKSTEIIKTFSDSRIKHIENERNLGLVGNWNKCLEMSTGEYVCIFHQDDTMERTNLEKKVEVLNDNPGIGMVFSDTLIINQKGEIKSEHWFNPVEPNIDFFRPGKSFFEMMFTNLNLVCCPGVVARRECYEKIGGFDERLPFSCDMEMWMRISLFYDVAYLSRPLIQYRFHETNLTNQYLDLDLIHIYLCKKILLEKYPEEMDASYPDILIRESTQRIYERAIHHFHMNQHKTARQYVYFLGKIQKKLSSPTFMDNLIQQLGTINDQANALEILSKIYATDGLQTSPLTQVSKTLPNRNDRILKLIDTLKPHIPKVLTKPLRSIWHNIPRK